MRYLMTILLSVLVPAVVSCSSDNQPVAPGADTNPAVALSPDPSGPSRSETQPGAGTSPITKPLSKKIQVLENCRTVQAAVEAFAAENGGVYPTSLAARSALGNTVIDLLPEGRLLKNPFTAARTEPADGAAAQPGQTGYVCHVCGGQTDGYVITGSGPTYRLCVTIVRECNGDLVEIVGRSND